jgi:hypothetical protein
MIHDVTIPFRFDTSPIERQIESYGAELVGKAIADTVRQGIYSVMPKVNGWYNDRTPTKDSEVNWRAYVDERMKAWLDENKQEVIDEAALLLAMRAGRKKAWREVLEELKAERDAE